MECEAAGDRVVAQSCERWSDRGLSWAAVGCGARSHGPGRPSARAEGKALSHLRGGVSPSS